MECPERHSYVESDVFAEYQRRLEDQKSRWDKRLDALDMEVKELRKLTTSVETLANNMQRMFEEQRKQGERLETLESRDGELWRKSVGYLLTALASAVVTLVFMKLGLR